MPFAKSPPHCSTVAFPWQVTTPSNVCWTSGNAGMGRFISRRGSRAGVIFRAIDRIFAKDQLDSSNPMSCQPSSALLPSTLSLRSRNGGPSRESHSEDDTSCLETFFLVFHVSSVWRIWFYESISILWFHLLDICEPLSHKTPEDPAVEFEPTMSYKHLKLKTAKLGHSIHSRLRSESPKYLRFHNTTESDSSCKDQNWHFVR